MSGAPRATGRRQPFGRRRQGDGTRCPRAIAAEAPENRRAGHAAAAFGLFSLHSQPLAPRPPAYARFLHAHRGGPADGRRRLRDRAGRDGADLSLCARRRRSTGGHRFSRVGAGADGDRSGGATGLGHGADGEPVAGSGDLVADVRVTASSAKEDKKSWRQRWDPFGMCSWPPEDDRIESFHRHVRDQAKAMLARTWREPRNSRPACATASISGKR